MAAQQQPPPPYYQSQGVPVLPGNNLVQITSGDSPAASGPFLTAMPPNGLGLGGGAGNFIVTSVSWTFNFNLFLVWAMPAGAGAPAQPQGAGGNVIYTLGTRPWSVVFQATASMAGGWADTIAAASGVFTPADFSIDDTNPVVAAPAANRAARTA